jgi:hypothetical protein
MKWQASDKDKVPIDTVLPLDENSNPVQGD